MITLEPVGREVMPSDFGEKLKQLREDAGLSQYGLSKKSGVTQQAISRYELGEREPTWHAVQLLCLALKVDCSELRDKDLKVPEDVELRGPGRPPKESPPEADDGE